MNRILKDKKNILFDFDGVLAPTNKIKSTIFRSLGDDFNKEAGNYFYKYHIKHGGISRHTKFSHYYKYLQSHHKMTNLLSEQEFCKDLSIKFAEIYKSNLSNIIFSNQKRELLKTLHKNYKLFILSGGDKGEILEILKLNDCDIFFHKIMGNDKDKVAHFRELVSQDKNFNKESIFIGDSRYDGIAALQANIDFIFVYKYTEFQKWKTFCYKNDFIYFSDIMSFFK